MKRKKYNYIYMSCLHPLLAVSLGVNPTNGKKILRIKGHFEDNVAKLFDKYGQENVYFIPCGKCDECIKAKRREWSIRCELEARSHKDNCFVTLTYADEPLTMDQVKHDVQLFIRYVRRNDIKIRYFGCGEKGDLSGRKHAHLIIFGWKPSDMKYYSKTKSGAYQFTSRFIDSVWKKGFATVSEFEPACGAYVAGYAAKKLSDHDGFILMSTRPGIGFEYFVNHLDQIYQCDSISVRFGNHIAKVPRYLDKIAEGLDMDLSEIKQKRIEFANSSLFTEARQRGIINIDEVFASRANNKVRFQVNRKRDL